MRWSLRRWSAALALIALVLFATNAIRPIFPWFVLWLPGLSALTLMVVTFWRTARDEEQPPQIRRFWTHLSWVAVFVAAGYTAQASEVLAAADPSGPHISTVQQVFHGIAVLIVMYALFRLPFGQASRGETLRVVLDAGTVMLACAVFLWHFVTRHTLEGGDPSEVFTSLVLVVVAMLCVFAVAKFMLTSNSFLTPGTLRLIGLAILVGCFGPLLRPFFESIDPNLFPDSIDMAVLAFFGIWAADRQRVVSPAPKRGGAIKNRKRPFSLLPYAGVAALDGLLLSVTWAGSDSDERVVVASAVLLTAIVVVRQITAFRDNGRLLRRLDHGATHDALTQLPNRALFHERLQKALTAPGDRPVAVALIDLDDFKEVNDTLGHEVGDLLLVAVAQRLSSCIRAEDTVARLGGDEFVVVLADADPAAADLAAERMIEALRAPVVADGHELPIRASIGIADGGAGDDPSVLLRQADIAMYAAKKIPGTASLHYDPGMAATGTDHAPLGHELREAITGGQLFLLYQPIVRLSDGYVVGGEALVRWAHPEHGTLAPDTFIPVAERTGLIVPLSHWVLSTAIHQLAHWPAADLPMLNINISVRDLREPGFARSVAALLAETRVDPGRLTLEITESMTLEPGEALDNLNALRGMGLRVSLDDFGTGASTLSTLHDYPVDELKLDRAFTQADADTRVPMAAAVMRLASALGLHAVAEGVETGDQADRLRALGYEAAQGFHYARPMTADRFGECLGSSLTPTLTGRP